MTLFEQLKYQGIVIASNVDIMSLMGMLRSLPIIQNMFGDIYSMIDTLQSYYDKFNELKKTLAQLKDKVTQAQEKLKTIERAYDQILNLPGAYIATPVVGGPVTPNATVPAGYQAIVMADNALEKAKEAVQKMEDKVNSQDEKVKNYAKSIVEKLIKTQV